MTDLQKTDALVSAAQAGDDTAFQRLISQHRLQVYGVVQKMIGHPQDTDDIVQEALLKAWRSLPQFRGDSAFSTWLISIATRSALDFLRDQKRWRAEAQVAYANLCAESEELSGEVIAAFMEPEFAFDVRQHISYCFACVGRSLPPDEMAALVLRDFAELSAREAATALGISDSVLRHRLSSPNVLRSSVARMEPQCVGCTIFFGGARKKLRNRGWGQLSPTAPVARISTLEL